MQAFSAILTPVLMLFLCMAIGFTLKKTNIVPDNAATTLAKLQTWVFCPALAFMAMSTSFTVERIIEHSTNLVFAVITLCISLLLGLGLVGFFVKDKTYERAVYSYALVFANLGYMAEPLIQAMFSETVLGAYKFFCLPFTIVIYTWGISILSPKSDKNQPVLKRILNFPTVALLLGIFVGLTGTLGYIPAFIISTLNSLKVCMGPVAMIIAGITIARYNVPKLLKNKKVYVATLFRLIILPTLLIAAAAGVRLLGNSLFRLEIGTAPIYFVFFASAMPLGMNTVVFPEAYGGDPEPGASMALISSTLSVITVPLLYLALSTIFPIPF